MRGALITIYGINNLGKTTHATILAKNLEKLGLKVKLIKYPIYDIEPSGTFLNSVIRSEKQNMTEEELQLWYVINRYQYQAELERLLNDGFIVIAEDYSGTGIAWGIAKGLDEKWIIDANKYLINPDLAILFEGKRMLSAKEKIHIHEQNDELMEKCREVHVHLAEKFGWVRMLIEGTINNSAKKLWSIVEIFLVSNGYLDMDRKGAGLKSEKMLSSKEFEILES